MREHLSRESKKDVSYEENQDLICTRTRQIQIQIQHLMYLLWYNLYNLYGIICAYVYNKYRPSIIIIVHEK